MEEALSPGTALAAFVKGILGGRIVRAEPSSRSSAGATVWKVEGAHGPAVLKSHGSAAKHARERDAYLLWLRALADRTAPLLGVRDEPPRALLLEHRPGRVGVRAEAAEAATVHRQAGGWLARLHDLPHRDDDPLDLAEAYGERAAAWFARAGKVLGRHRLREARAVVEEALPALRGRRRVPCHRDFTPRNWLVEGPRLTAVIDFEHARPDLPEADLVRLGVQVWRDRPGLRDAFLDGYRSVRALRLPPWWAGLEVLEAVATLAWAAEHDDPTFARAAWAVLERHA